MPRDAEKKMLRSLQDLGDFAHQEILQSLTIILASSLIGSCAIATSPHDFPVRAHRAFHVACAPKIRFAQPLI